MVTHNCFCEANGNFPTMFALLVGFITQMSCLVVSWLEGPSYCQLAVPGKSFQQRKADPNLFSCKANTVPVRNSVSVFLCVHSSQVDFRPENLVIIWDFLMLK